LRQFQLFFSKRCQARAVVQSVCNNENMSRSASAIPLQIEYPKLLRGEIMVNLMTEHEVSKRINVSVASLRRWRLLGRGPAFVKVGSLVRYEPEDLEAWLASLPTGGTANHKQLPSGASIRQVDSSK
jgi:hypothetical protein